MQRLIHLWSQQGIQHLGCHGVGAHHSDIRWVAGEVVDDVHVEPLLSAVRNEVHCVPLEEVPHGFPRQDLAPQPAHLELQVACGIQAVGEDRVHNPLVHCQVQLRGRLFEMKQGQGPLGVDVLDVLLQVAPVYIDLAAFPILDHVGVFPDPADHPTWPHPVGLQLLAWTSPGAQPPDLLLRCQCREVSPMDIDLLRPLLMEGVEGLGHLAVDLRLSLEECHCIRRCLWWLVRDSRVRSIPPIQDLVRGEPAGTRHIMQQPDGSRQGLDPAQAFFGLELAESLLDLRPGHLSAPIRWVVVCLRICLADAQHGAHRAPPRPSEVGAAVRGDGRGQAMWRPPCLVHRLCHLGGGESP